MYIRLVLASSNVVSVTKLNDKAACKIELKSRKYVLNVRRFEQSCIYQYWWICVLQYWLSEYRLKLRIGATLHLARENLGYDTHVCAPSRTITWSATSTVRSEGLSVYDCPQDNPNMFGNELSVLLLLHYVSFPFPFLLPIVCPSPSPPRPWWTVLRGCMWVGGYGGGG